MKQKYIVTLTSTKRNQIQEIANDHTISNTIRKRANILLLADTTPGKPMPQAEIAKRCNTSTITVYNTLKSYTTHDPAHTLKFKRTKTTNPPIITGDKEAQIIALACNQPPKASHAGPYAC
jgi:transcriptional regulator GlxA family with amidase domain